MKKIYFYLLLFLFFCQNTSFAQSFEGIIRTEIEYPASAPFEAVWYIKGNDIALELYLEEKGKPYSIKFIPHIDKNKMTVISNTPTGKFKHSLDLPQAVQTKPVLTVHNKGENQYEALSNEYTTILTLDNTVRVNWSPYQKFFLDDYGIDLMVAANLKGFPTEYSTKKTDGSFLRKMKVKKIDSIKLSKDIFND